jgi:chromosome partitioning protein
LGSIELIQKHLNPQLSLQTILLTMFDGRTNLANQVADDVRSHFTDKVLQAVIPRAVRISEAPSFGQTVISYDPSSLGAISYLEAANEMARRYGDKLTTSPQN